MSLLYLILHILIRNEFERIKENIEKIKKEETLEGNTIQQNIINKFR